MSPPSDEAAMPKPQERDSTPPPPMCLPSDGAAVENVALQAAVYQEDLAVLPQKFLQLQRDCAEKESLCKRYKRELELLQEASKKAEAALQAAVHRHNTTFARWEECSAQVTYLEEALKNAGLEIKALTNEVTRLRSQVSLLTNQQIKDGNAKEIAEPSSNSANPIFRITEIPSLPDPLGGNGWCSPEKVEHRTVPKTRKGPQGSGAPKENGGERRNLSHQESNPQDLLSLLSFPDNNFSFPWASGLGRTSSESETREPNHVDLEV